MMWMLYAAGSSFFAGITAILAKCGIRKTDSDVATGIRTVVVLAFSWLMVLITGSGGEIRQLDPKTIWFLILSGLATGASWLCYFHALQLGDVNKVVPIDKSSTVLTILLALIFLGEGLTLGKAAAAVLIGFGTLMMIGKAEDQKKGADLEAGHGRNAVSKAKSQTKGSDFAEAKEKTDEKKKGRSWLLYAVLSAVFASLTAILGKIGIEGVDSNLGTAIRTTVVLVMAWLMVAVKGKWREVSGISKRELRFICLSGLATGASWLCYYRALQEGPASVVVPIDKLSILVTMGFSWIVFHEKLTRKAGAGLGCIVIGTIWLAAL